MDKDNADRAPVELSWLVGQNTPSAAASNAGRVGAGLPVKAGRAVAIGVALILTNACSEAHSSQRALSTQGLYRDIASKQVVGTALEYVPDYPLWSDGIQKRRWLILPEGEVIDTTDMDHWQFPVGTKLFKEFSQYGQLLETRLVERIAATGRFKRDYKLATYVWQDDQLDAQQTAGGVQNVLGTDHNVPAQKLCRECHRGEPGAVLGFSALQLSRSGILDTLVDAGLLSVDLEPTFVPFGDEIAAEATGYLHANCGHCHSSTGQAPGAMHLRLATAELDGPIEQTELYTSTIGQRLTEWKDHPHAIEFRVVPGDPEHSAIYYRMKQRGGEEPSREQMPPLATERQHIEGLALVKAWIATLAEKAFVSREDDSVAASSDSGTEDTPADAGVGDAGG